MFGRSDVGDEGEGVTPKTLPKKKKSPKVFTYLKAVSMTKSLAHLDDIDFDEHYIPWLINRGLSFHQDAVLAMNSMNERPWLAPSLQFRFLLNTLRARSRFSPWLKRVISADVVLVAEYYGCSVRHAQSLLDLHSEDQLRTVRARLYKGGVTSKKDAGYDK